MKTGRNDPCLCGSGKKYKRCCLLNEQPAGDELTPRILGRCVDLTAEALARHAQATAGQNHLARAWTAFWGEDDLLDVPQPANSPYMPLFLTWMLYHWIPAEGETGTMETGFPNDGTVAASFLRHEGWKVDDLTRRFIDCSRRSPLSFWQAEAVEAGRGILLRNMLTDEECFAHDRTSSETVSPWDILLCQVVEVDEVCVLGAMAPYSLPPLKFRQTVENFLSTWRNDHATGGDSSWLLEVDVDQIWFYHGCVEDLLNPAVPELLNSDGDRLEWTTSTFRFDPQDRGRILGRLDSMRNIHGDSQLDDDEYVWVSQRKDSAIPHANKAHIAVQDELLVTECNSRRRDRDLRGRLRKSMDDLLRYEDTAYRPFDMASAGSAGNQEAETSRLLDLEQLPAEARAELDRVMEDRHLSWADETVPALGGKTPRQAVATPGGRRQVEQLVNDFENSQLRRQHKQYCFDFNKLRRDLGLPEE